MKKKILIGVGAFFALAVIAIIAGTLFGETPEEFANESIAKLTEGTGSVERSDAVYNLAKNQANTTSGLPHDTMMDGAISYLKKHSDNFYESNDTMEVSMYFGSYITNYLESKNKKLTSMTEHEQTLYQAGYQTVKAIKYVYRGNESQNDDDTIKALEKAQKALNKL